MSARLPEQEWVHLTGKYSKLTNCRGYVEWLMWNDKDFLYEISWNFKRTEKKLEKIALTNFELEYLCNRGDHLSHFLRGKGKR